MCSYLPQGKLDKFASFGWVMGWGGFLWRNIAHQKLKITKLLGKVRILYLASQFLHCLRLSPRPYFDIHYTIHRPPQYPQYETSFTPMKWNPTSPLPTSFTQSHIYNIVCSLGYLRYQIDIRGVLSLLHQRSLWGVLKPTILIQL